MVPSVPRRLRTAANRANERATNRRQDAALILKDRDSWWTVLVIDPLAVRVLPPLARWPVVTPIRLTATAAGFGVASTVLFALGYLWVAAICFEIRFFLDCLDGKLARLRGIASPRGAFLDFGCDVLLIGFNLAALGGYLVVDRDVAPWLPMAVVVLALVLFWLQVYHQWYPGPPASGEPVMASNRGLFGRWRSVLASRRLVWAPRTIEIETLVLFLVPIVGKTSWMVAAFAVAGVYYTIASTRLAVIVYGHLPHGTASPRPGQPGTKPAPAVGSDRGEPANTVDGKQQAEETPASGGMPQPTSDP